MRAYISLDTVPEPGDRIPPGTAAATEPREALREAQRAGKPWILLFTAPRSKPILSAGRTTRELDPCRPSRVYRTERATVCAYQEGIAASHRERLRTV